MPILHTQITAQGKAPDGSVVAIPSPVALIARGPTIQVVVGVEEHIAQKLAQQGVSLPVPISGWALIDTGASSTCIDDAAAQKLHLPVVDVVTIASASHSATQQNVYPIQIDFMGVPIKINAPRAVGAPLAAQNLLVLIGRDALQNCTLFYNGLAGTFTIHA